MWVSQISLGLFLLLGQLAGLDTRGCAGPYSCSHPSVTLLSCMASVDSELFENDPLIFLSLEPGYFPLCWRKF